MFTAAARGVADGRMHVPAAQIEPPIPQPQEMMTGYADIPQIAGRLRAIFRPIEARCHKLKKEGPHRGAIAGPSGFRRLAEHALRSVGNYDKTAGRACVCEHFVIPQSLNTR